MKITRSLTLTCAAALMVGACSGADVDPTTSSVVTPTTPTTAGLATSSSSPSSAASMTSAPSTSDVPSSSGSATSPATTPTPTVPVSPGAVAGLEPEVALAQVRVTLGRSRTADRATGTTAERYRKLAYSGPALASARAREKLRDLLPPQTTQTVARDAVPPNLLALSRAPRSPVVTLLQTVPTKGALPELYLMKTNKPGTRSLIHWRAAMRPGARLGLFDARAEGSPLLSARTQKLNGTPQLLLRQYAAALGGETFTTKGRLYKADTYVLSVRDAAEREWEAVNDQAAFSQRYTVLPESIITLAKPGGGALVFGVIERVDSYRVKDGGGYLTGSRAWLALKPRETQIREQARMTSLHFVAFDVPPAGSTRKAVLVAASDQLISADGE